MPSSTDRTRRARSSRSGPRKLGPLSIGRWILLLLAVVLFAGAGFVGYAYEATAVPKPEDVANDQFSTVYYSDGTTEMARLGSQNRIIVPLTKVPDYVQKAVLSAENRTFYTDPGFSVTGTVRAAWLNLTTNETPGGSTITQQYVKNAYLTQEKTLTRKFKELIIAIKLEKSYSKDQILGYYLNTIYFGRGAYGIEAAAETYFGKPVDQLTPAEGAVLASSIRSPAGYDPQNHPAAAQQRWTYVVDGMVSSKWLSAADRAALVYPTVQPISTGSLNNLGGPQGLIIQRVKAELRGLGIDESEIYSRGLKIVTTVDKGAQDAADATVTSKLAEQPANLVGGLVAVDPKTGGITSYYGGQEGTGFDFAGRAYRQPGSSFKPFTLVAALENGFSVNSLRDGSSGQTFPGRSTPVRNSGGSGCSSCSLKTAITNSYNTTFYGLAYDLGPDKVKQAAFDAGIPQKRLDTGAPMMVDANGVTSPGIGIGQYEVTVQDMASAFATFAAGGVYRAPHFVQKVTDSTGKDVYAWTDQGKQTIPADVANDVSFALSGVAAYSKDPLDDNRPVAAKTGTVQLGDDNNKDAWMVGYTPQISTAVWIGTKGSDPILNAQGGIIYGAGVPGKIWQAYMNQVLTGQPVEKLPTKSLIKATIGDEGGSGSGSGGGGTASSSSAAPQSSSEPAPPTTTDPAPPPSSSEPAPPATSSSAAPAPAPGG